VTDARYQLHEGRLRVLVGKERFSEIHPWSDMSQHWPESLDGRVVIEVVAQGQLEARLIDGGPPVDVVVPLFSALPGRAIRAGRFGLIQQFGVGVDNIDLDAAAEEGVLVANMGQARMPFPSPSTPSRCSSHWLGASQRPQKASSPAIGGSPRAAHSVVRQHASSVLAPLAPRSPAGSLPST
jgi:hypothetical protein